uniref:non-specific serine/threonine protein kinase n=1 Tax=Nannospalax galili TaxID=1026970 RepID=A0A8C6W3P3_NANGA
MSSVWEEELEEPSPVPSAFKEKTFHSQYTVLRTLGQGNQAKVLLAQHRLSGTLVAVKVLLKEKQWCKPVFSEVDIMMMTEHPNIISLLQVVETEKRTYLVMELVLGQELLQVIQKTGGLLEEEAREIFRQIVRAVGYCHDNGIVHRDLKPENIMITEAGKVKVLDFGFSTQVKPGQKLRHHCGSHAYAAPELYLFDSYDGPKVDVWALGVILYYMVVGCLPFDAVIVHDLRWQIVRGEYFIPCHLSKECQDLLRLLLTANPRRRPTLDEVGSHPWLMKDREDLPDDWEEMVPRQPDPAIMQAMKDLGFHAKDTKNSLINRKFNESMATYCLLHSQARQEHGPTSQAQPINPGVTPFPSLEDPATFNLAPRRRASEPMCKQLWSSSDDEMSEWDQQAGQRGGRCATGSANPLGGPVRRMPIGSPACQCAISAPCLYSASGKEGGTEDLQSHNPNVTEASSQGRRRGFRLWTQRIGNSLLRLFCCLPSRRKPRLGQNRVSPQK